MKKITLLTLFAILVPLIVFGFLGCMKKPDHTPDYGPESSITEIQKAALDNVPPDPLSIKTDQYVSIDVSQVVDTQPPVTLTQKLDKVTATVDSTKETQWTFETQMNELNNSGTWKNYIDHHELTYEKSQSQSLSAQGLAAEPTRLSAYTLKALSTSDAQTPVKVTYHNLKREEGLMPAPLLVQKKADCGGLGAANCSKGLRYIRLSFDRVIWNEDNKGTKTSYRIIYSPDIPTYVADWTEPEGIYLTNQLQFCAQTWLTIQNGNQDQVVPVQQCADMRDFQVVKGVQ